jgi:hypothetical protein
VASLLDQQRAFAAALSGSTLHEDAHGPPAVRPIANLGVYRNNSDWQFRNALALSFPVVRRRVGDDFFRQLAARYRRRYPSRSGDLHWVGRDFATFLAHELAGGDYSWLADLAALEWAREVASVAGTLPATGAEVLAAVPPEDLEHLVFTLQPSLQLGSSAFPVVSVWRANQAENAPPVDQSAGEEAYMILNSDDGPQVTQLGPSLQLFLSALSSGAPLGAAMTLSGLDEPGLLAALQLMFAHNLICGVHSEKR